MYGDGRLQNLDFLLRMMGRNMLEGGGSILEVTEDDRRCGSTMDDDRSGRSMRMLSEDDGRWRFDILQSHFQRAGGAHAYQRHLLKLQIPLFLVVSEMRSLAIRNCRCVY